MHTLSVLPALTCSGFRDIVSHLWASGSHYLAKVAYYSNQLHFFVSNNNSIVMMEPVVRLHVSEKVTLLVAPFILTPLFPSVLNASMMPQNYKG